MRIRSTSTGRAVSRSRPTWGWTRFSFTGSTMQKGTLEPNDPPFASVAAKSGPRHFAFHPGGRFGYVISEMANTVTAFEYDSSRGELTEIQSISTLPEDFRGASFTAEVQVHPSGKFVYGSNRGHDSIAIFAVDPETGKLQLRGHRADAGSQPCAISRSIRRGRTFWPRMVIRARSWCSGSISRPVGCGPPGRASAWRSRFASRWFRSPPEQPARVCRSSFHGRVGMNERDCSLS